MERKGLESQAADAVQEILAGLRIDPRNVKSVSIHGAAAIRKIGRESKLLVILRGSHSLRLHRIRNQIADLIISLGEVEFEKDCLKEELGGAAAGSLLLPYISLIGEEFVKKCEVLYKRHITLESLQNLILEHRLASPRLLIKSAYFLYDKLRRLCAVYPLIRPYVKATFGEDPERSLEMSLRGFEKALEQLVSEGILVQKSLGRYAPTEKFVHEVLSRISIYSKVSRELEHVFKLYLTASLSSPLEAIKDLSFDLRFLKPVKLPEPSEMIEIETSLGPQPLLVDFGIKEFIEKTYGVKKSEVKLRKIAGVLNSAYMVEFKMDGSDMKIFVKRYLNWTDFKWVAAWLWAIGVKNFSLLAPIRMSNEIYFVNKLMELGFDVAEILHVNWPRKIIFQRYIEGKDLAEVLSSCKSGEEVEEKGVKIGDILGRLHRRGISMGDCNPFSFIFSKDGKIYLVDLEQCSYDESFSWDIAELLYYTSRYLEAEDVEKFASGFVKGYLRWGEPGEIVKAMDLRYARVLAPLTLPWIRSKLKEAVMRAVKK